MDSCTVAEIECHLVLNDLCNDVQSIARKCGQNMLDNYGREFIIVNVIYRHACRKNQGFLSRSCHQGGYGKPEYDQIVLVVIKTFTQIYGGTVSYPCAFGRRGC